MRHPGRGAAAARGLASLSVVLAVLVLPPLFLSRAVGWPLPTSIPSSAAVERALQFGPSDEVIISAIAIVAWLAWAQAALALVVEIVAAARGRASIGLPALPGTQAIAARLAAGLMLLVVVAQPSQAAARVATAAPPSALEIVALDEAPDLRLVDDSTGLEEPAEPAPAPASAPTVTVQRHDTYWAIAERTLGDGVRWREIHALNTGRTMSDGHVIASSSDLLRPGWVLHLPADAATNDDDQGELPEAATAAGGGEVVVEPGDHLWAIAEEELEATLGRAATDAEIDPVWRDLIDANRHRFADPTNPSLIYPGQTFLLPPPFARPTHTAEPAPVPPEAPPAMEAEAPEESSQDGEWERGDAGVSPERADPLPSAVPENSTEQEPDAADDADGGRDIGGVLAVGALASAAMAVGLVQTVRHRRRRFLHRHPGRIHAGTPDAEAPVLRAAARNSDVEPLDDLRSVLGALAQDLAETGGTARPRIVQHSPHHIDIFLADPDREPPSGWTPAADGALWSLDPSHDRRASRTCAAPLLVTLGQPDDDGQLYIDLEADGILSLVGDPDSARGLARSILTELSLGPLTDTVEIVVVGDLIDATVSALDHVGLFDTWDEVLDNLTEWSVGSHSAMVANGWPNTFVARGHDEFHDALSPLVVIAAKAPPSDVATTIAAHRPSAVALVVADEVAAPATVIDCRPDALTVADLDLSCLPQDLDEDTFDSMMRLLVSAETPAELAGSDSEPFPPEMSEPAADDVDDRVVDHDEAPEPADPDYAILVRVLGDITVEGVEPLSPKLTAAFAYIALHRSVTVEALEEACWSNLGSTSRRRMRDAMSECRRIVGSQHLPQATTGRYEVRPSVVTDAELFDLGISRAAQLPAEQAVGLYRSALGLVTGKVFTYPSRTSDAYTWIDAENLVSQWEVRIAGVAQQCAETYLELGHPTDAVAVALIGLNAIPAHTGLTECLMRSHAAGCDLHSVDAAYRAHVEALERLYDSEPEVSTVKLHGELMAGRSSAR